MTSILSFLETPQIFLIPTHSNDTLSRQIVDTYYLDNTIKIYSLHLGTDYPQFSSNPGVTDILFGSNPSFSSCLEMCAGWENGSGLSENEGNVTDFSGCTGISWVNGVCFLKSGLITEDLVPTFRGDAASAILHFLT